MRWFLPSWNGDIRAESKGDETELTIIDPTTYEQEVLKLLEKIFRNKKWYTANEPLWRHPLHIVDPDEPLGRALANNVPESVYRKTPVQVRRTIHAPLSDVAPLLVKGYKPGAATLTAVVLKDGSVETVSGSGPDLDALAKMAEEKGAETATSVKRPTPSCPECHPGAIEPATEVLLSFLNEQQHQQWAAERCIMVQGCYSGHRYLLAHRHSQRAQKQGKFGWDLDDNQVMHFHDHTVPPEEEVLAAKLILEHREDWLRNEATCLGDHTDKFKNPFGDCTDGIPDAAFTASVGAAFMYLTEGKQP